MTKVLENGQLEWLLEEMTFEQLEQSLKVVNEKREKLQLVFIQKLSSKEFATYYNQLLELNNLSSQIIIQMNYKAWEV